MTYWLHRCKHEGGWDLLDNEKRLTIGFSDCANDADMLEAIQKKAGDKFDEIYKTIYGGEIWRSRWSLWYFTCEMKADDFVVIPRAYGFTVCRLKGTVKPSLLKNERDIGFEWEVDIIADNCSPRESYATTGLLSRMKSLNTTLNINDLSKDVDIALERYRSNRPFSLPAELAKKCHELLDVFGSPDHFERLLCDYFTRLGGNSEILAKNYAGKVGDCDVTAVFPALHLTISVQAKKHWGQTGDWAIRQILDYANSRESIEPNWTYVNWVVSFADDFSEEAKNQAAKYGVILLNGIDFCHMLVANGVGLA